MAKNKNDFYVHGKSADELMDMTDLYEMGMEESKAILNRLVSVANKRIRRLIKSKSISPSLISRMKKKGKKGGIRLSIDNIRMFTSKKVKDVNDVRQRIKQVRQFLNQKTSTVRGYKTYRKIVVDKLGHEFKNKSEEKRFWAVYNRLVDENGGEIFNVFDSKQIQKWLQEESGGERMSRADLWEKIQKRLDKEYQKNLDEIENEIEEERRRYGEGFDEGENPWD